jgi:hypothetical protein
MELFGSLVVMDMRVVLLVSVLIFSFFLFEVFEIGRNQTELEKHRLLQ